MLPNKQEFLTKPSLTHQLHSSSTSALRRYLNKAVGDAGPFYFAYYECVNLLLSNLPSSIGYVLRKFFFRYLFRSSGNGLILGRGLSIRHPRKISFGHRVAVDDYVLLDASGAGTEGISFKDDVIISRNCVIQGKAGPITIGAKCDIGCNTILSAISGIHFGEHVLIAANCYIGGGQYVMGHTGVPMMDQELSTKGPVVLGDDVWLGAGVTVLDGVRIGTGCVVGAGAVVTNNLPDFAVAVGVPAKIIRYRNKSD